MQLVSIETTPNPNSMKLNLSERALRSHTYTGATIEECPGDFRPLLNIEGVKSIFVCDTFITLNKNALADWKPILDEVTKTFDTSAPSQTPDLAPIRSNEVDKNLDQVAVAVQTFFNIPIQVRATNDSGQKRIALDERFSKTAERVQQLTGADYLKERHWVDYGSRYGSLEDAAQEVADEIHDTIDDDYLASALHKASRISELDSALKSPERIRERHEAAMSSDDWLERLQAAQELTVTTETLALFINALSDPSHQVRRIVCAALGASGLEEAVAPLCEVLLDDSSPGVRRTAGDALSDIGDSSAQTSMCKALSDSNKLVRWRAARYLRDLGDRDALPHLASASNDVAFEVQLEAEAAIERISGNKESILPAWKRIVNG